MPDALHAAKLKARERLHRRLSRSANCFPTGDPQEQPELVTVRILSKWDAVGELAGTSYQYAEQQDEIPRIIFDIREFDPDRNAVVCLSSDEMYVLDASDPPDDFTVTFKAARMLPSQYATFYPPSL